MSLQHFFLEKQDFAKDVKTSGNNVSLNLSKEDLHHAHVLRLKNGEHIGVIDSKGVFLEVEVVDFSNSLVVKNCTKENTEAPDKTKLWLCPGISKSNKLDDVIRACTEIGVYGFIPVAFERSVAKLDEAKESNKNERWQKIAKSAAMQSGQYFIPKINHSVDVNTLCEQLSDFDYIFVCWEEATSMQDLVSACNKIKEVKEEQNIAIIIGPEGGITQAEVDSLKECNKNTKVVSIGNSILRTETAGVVASAIIKFNLSC